MAKISHEEIMGYFVGEVLLCTECISDEQSENVTLDDLLLRDSLEEDSLHFCDNCKKQIA